MWKLKLGGDERDPLLFSLNNFTGRQTWEFDPDAGTPEERAEIEAARQNFYENRFKVRADSDLFWRFQFLREKNFKHTIPPVKIKDGEEITYEKATAAVKRCVSFWAALQSDHGHWPAENAGPGFYFPPLVMCMYITGHLNTVFHAEHRREILRYIYYHQNEDGGWGLHIEGHSTMMVTVLNYVCMRLLGEGPDGGLDNACQRGRKWILDHGGAMASSSWGKTWLAIIGASDWAGCHPMPPEFWMTCCVTAATYMPMSYLYGKKFVGPITPLIKQIRREIYNEPYEEIKWWKVRHLCAKEDTHYPHTPLQTLMWDALYFGTEPLLSMWPFKKIREMALEKTMEHIHYEDENSRYITIGCVEKPLNMLACWDEDPDGEAFKKHLSRIADYVWIGEDGIKIQSLGSQVWDCGLSLQCLLASNLSDDLGPVFKKGHEFLKKSQVDCNPSGNFRKMFRRISKGAWTFSDKDHGWQVSDCTAESLKCILHFSMMPPETVGEQMESEKMYDAVNVILSLQSKNGGVSAWEPSLAGSWLEMLNPVEFLEGVVIEEEYVECTSSCIQALVLFKKLFPSHRKHEIDNFLVNAAQFIQDTQKSDGSWYCLIACNVFTE
ncbi:hypothetical protein SAY87_030676 [Trapa incisa]|uniref:Terpene cyclase/mutase family member n=1 Tax=Trapa incisa TaxID=236973 RepID=A0AAN7KS48_9MYRT|nr:hypothetical protein SAY87_030676 [Trapa incisa]